MGLFFVVLAVYIPLVSGHTSSRDEETAFYAAGSLLEGRLTRVSDQLRVVQVSYGVGGEPYSRYGLGVSALAAPMLRLGQVAAGLYSEQFRYFVERTFALASNALVTAGTASLLCILAQVLGYSTGRAFWLGAAYAFGTFAFPHGRTLFAEPGAGFFLLASMLMAAAWARGSSRHIYLMPLSGLAAGLAVVVKVHALLALPWLALYAVLLALQVRRPGFAFVPHLALWLAGCLAALGLLAAYNAAAFGSPLRTGYSGEAGRLIPNVFSADLYRGLVGLTVSPGKGLLIYAPPMLAALMSLPRFAARDRWTAFVSVGVGATALGFFSAVEFWHGDAAWGPRYMAMVLPFLILPAVAAFDSAKRWMRTLSAVLVAVGVLVQLLGTLVPFASYINAETDQQARYYQVYSSPVLGHARMLAARWQEWYSWLFHRERAVVVGNGFLNTGSLQLGALPRPMEREGVVVLSGLAPGRVQVSLMFRTLQGKTEDGSPPVAVWVDGAPVAGEYRWLDARLVEERFAFASSRPQATVKLEVVGAPSGQKLPGVELQAAVAQDAQGTLPVVRQIYIPPWPPNLYGRWNWFFDPTIHHPVDSWLWYGTAMGAFKGAGLILPSVALAVSAILLVAGLRLVRQGLAC